jgi:death-on-curing protein
MLDIKFLSVQEITLIHDSIISKLGGLSGVRDYGLLESAIQRPRNHFMYKDELSIPYLSSVYLHAIVCGHVFNDGNKRTSLKISEIFLIRNGYFLTASNFELEQLVLQLADNQIDFDFLSQMIDVFSVPYEL